jgi:hypothetical protein
MIKICISQKYLLRFASKKGDVAPRVGGNCVFRTEKRFYEVTL